MKVAVIYQGRRETVNEVEQLTFADFKLFVAPMFDLMPVMFDLYLGDRRVELEPQESLSDFGIISGDSLLVRLRPSFPTHQPRDDVPDPTISQTAGSSPSSSFAAGQPPPPEPPEPMNAVADASSATPSANNANSSAPSTAPPQLAANEALDAFVLRVTLPFMTSAGFEKLSRQSLSAPAENNAQGEEETAYVRLRFRHASTPANTAAEIVLCYFRDDDDAAAAQRDQRPPQARPITAVTLQAMRVGGGAGRRVPVANTLFVDARATVGEAFIDALTALKESILGPDNPFLRLLDSDCASEVFRHLSVRDALCLEATCRYACNACRRSRLLDDAFWKTRLRAKFGESSINAVQRDANAGTAPAATTTAGMSRSYRYEYTKRVFEAKRLQYACWDDNKFRELPNQFPLAGPFGRQPFTFPFPPRQPEPHHPFAPFASPLNPFGIGAGGSRNPDVNPLAPNPYGGVGLVMPQRPRNPSHGYPQTDPYPWPDPFLPDPMNPPDPDMPRGPPRRHPRQAPDDFGFEPGSDLLPRRGRGGPGSGVGPFSGGFGGGFGGFIG